MIFAFLATAAFALRKLANRRSFYSAGMQNS